MRGWRFNTRKCMELRYNWQITFVMRLHKIRLNHKSFLFWDPISVMCLLGGREEFLKQSTIILWTPAECPTVQLFNSILKPFTQERLIRFYKLRVQSYWLLPHIRLYDAPVRPPRMPTLACGLLQAEDNHGPTDLRRAFYCSYNCLKNLRQKTCTRKELIKI